MYPLKLIFALFMVLFLNESFGQASNAGDNSPAATDNERQRHAGDNTKTEGMPVVGGANDAESKAAVEEASNQLDGMCEVNGDFWTMCSKRGIKGEFVVDITIQGKGKVVTVFMVSSNATIDHQIALKNKLIDHQFPNIKLPKNKRVKFRYTLTLNC
jgi:hypothetical protein